MSNATLQDFINKINDIEEDIGKSQKRVEKLKIELEKKRKEEKDEKDKRKIAERIILIGNNVDKRIKRCNIKAKIYQQIKDENKDSELTDEELSNKNLKDLKDLKEKITSIISEHIDIKKPKKLWQAYELCTKLLKQQKQFDINNLDTELWINEIITINNTVSNTQEQQQEFDERRCGNCFENLNKCKLNKTCSVFDYGCGYGYGYGYGY